MKLRKRERERKKKEKKEWKEVSTVNNYKQAIIIPFPTVVTYIFAARYFQFEKLFVVVKMTWTSHFTDIKMYPKHLKRCRQGSME